jgi:hypothetical protein
MPKSTANGTSSLRPSACDFVLCQNFAFRISQVDGFSHQRYEDGSAVTIVNFKGYTQNIADPQHHLFDLLVHQLNPSLSQ